MRNKTTEIDLNNVSQFRAIGVIHILEMPVLSRCRDDVIHGYVFVDIRFVVDATALHGRIDDDNFVLVNPLPNLPRQPKSRSESKIEESKG